MLEAEGTVCFQPLCGAYAGRKSGGMPQKRNGRRIFREAMQIQMSLELAALQAAAKKQPHPIPGLGLAALSSGSSDGSDTWVHTAAVQASANPQLERCSTEITESCANFWGAIAVRERNCPEALCDLHRAAAALRRGEADNCAAEIRAYWNRMLSQEETLP